jgi:hypothetical protein
MKNKGDLSLRTEAILQEFGRTLAEIRIELSGPSLIYFYLADMVFEVVDKLVEEIARSQNLKIKACDEEPTDVNYAHGVGFSWTRTIWCLGVVEGYHVLAEAICGFNGGEGKAMLKEIKLIKGDVNERWAR